MPLKFRRGMDIGAIAAEDDQHLLESCFIETDMYNIVTDFSSRKRILVGRTGAGKSAILSRIKSVEKDVITFNPEDLSFSYIINTASLKYFREHGIDFDLFYQLLWRHVFIVRIMQEHYNIRDSKHAQEIRTGIISRFANNARKQQALQYL